MSGDVMAPGSLVADKRIVTLLTILFLLCLVAVMGNGFITAALGMKWLLQGTLSPHNKLLVSLAASRFCLQWVVIGKNIYIFLSPTVFPYNPVMQYLNLVWDFLNAVIIWLCTWLGFFYCVKIATFPHPVFLWLKYKVPEWVPWMLLSSVGFSGLTSFLCFIGNAIIYQNYLRTDWQSRNATGNSLRSSFERFYFFSVEVIMWTIPTVLFLIFMALLLTSLGRHMRKTFMKTLSGLQDPRAQAHIKALLTLFSFVILFTSCFLTLVLSSASNTPFHELRYWIWQVVIHLCIATHTIILLSSNPRLRVVLDRVCLQWLSLRTMVQ